jgi:glucokinase
MNEQQSNDTLKELLARLAVSEVRGAPSDVLDRQEGLRRLRAGMRRLQEDADEAKRVEDIIEAVEIDRHCAEMAWEAVNQRDLPAAERYLRCAAERGNDEAAYYLATLLRSRGLEFRRVGRNVDGNGLLAEAQRWHDQAVASGIAEVLGQTADEVTLSGQARPRDPQILAADTSRGGAVPASEPESTATGGIQEPAGHPGSEPCYAVGVELRPYKFIAVLIDNSGSQIASQQRELASMEVETVVRSIRATIKNLLVKATCTVRRDQVVLGVQLGGPVDTETGTVHFYRKDPPHSAADGRHFQWEDEELGPRLQRATGLRTVLENDSNALASWEQRFGVGQVARNFAVLLIREGVGGSVVTNGKLFPGPVEIGNFITWHGDERMSDAGQRGALESVTGTTGIIAGVSERAGFDVEDLNIAADLVDEPDADSRGLTAPFTAAGIATAGAIGYLINFAKPTHLALYLPTVLTQRGRRAADAFWEQAADFEEFVAFKAFRGCEVVKRSLEPTQGAVAAGLVALERCCPKPIGVSEQMDVKARR